MTIIAYRDGVLASDSAHYINGVCIGHTSKVSTYRGWLFGSCGEAGWDDDVLRVIDQLELQKASDRISWPDFPHDFACILVSPTGQVADISKACKWAPLEVSFLAIGAGCEVATGAMDQGADAREAVAAAIRWVKGCDGQVHSVTLAPGLCVRKVGARLDKHFVGLPAEIAADVGAKVREAPLSVARVECICVVGAGSLGPHHNRACPSWRAPV